MIGRVHRDAEPALTMLRAEGFSHQGYIDIFDGGPALECETRSIRAVRDSQPLVLAIGTPGDEAPQYLIHNRKREDRRITVGRRARPPAPWWTPPRGAYAQGRRRPGARGAAVRPGRRLAVLPLISLPRCSERDPP